MLSPAERHERRVQENPTASASASPTSCVLAIKLDKPPCLLHVRYGTNVSKRDVIVLPDTCAHGHDSRGGGAEVEKSRAAARCCVLRD